MPLGYWTGMEGNPDILRIRLERLLKLAELVWHAAPEDRVRIERTIRRFDRHPWW
jgi:hypothetical protein